jgi:hypothetical protein
MLGRKGAKVYQWEDVDGAHIRTWINWGELEDIWEETPNKHMQYNTFDDEWDICEAFDPTKGIKDEDFFGNDQYEYDEPGKTFDYDPVRIPVSMQHAAAPEPTSLEASHNDILVMFGSGDSHSQNTAPKFSGSLEISEMQGSGYPHEYFPGVFRGQGQGLTVWTPYPSRVTLGYCDTPGYNVTTIKEH